MLYVVYAWTKQTLRSRKRTLNRHVMQLNWFHDANYLVLHVLHVLQKLMLSKQSQVRIHHTHYFTIMEEWEGMKIFIYCAVFTGNIRELCLNGTLPLNIAWRNSFGKTQGISNRPYRYNNVAPSSGSSWYDAVCEDLIASANQRQPCARPRTRLLRWCAA